MPPLDVKTEFSAIRTRYKEDKSRDTYNALILGKFGTGKTYLLQTCRAPILLHSFDPGGPKTIKKAIEDGRVLVQSFEADDPKNPTQFTAWERELDRMRTSGFFSNIGTLAIDSSTTWVQAIANRIAKMQGRTDGVLKIQDYQILGMAVKQALACCTSLPCDFILTGHIETEKDEVTGKSETAISLIPSLQKFLPLLFDEVYVSMVIEDSKGLHYKLLTRSTGQYTARTRLGTDGKFEMYEEPNIKALLKKANYPDQDKEIYLT